MTPAQFKIRFPEFARASLEMIESHLDGAATRIDEANAGALYDELHGYLAAHMLALSPAGQAAKLQGKDGQTTYLKHFNATLSLVGGPVVA